MLLSLATLAVCARAATQPSGTDDAALEALQQAHAGDILYRNAVYLYLRLAGIVWVAVEWAAALLLWRAYRILRAAATAGAQRGT